MIGDVGVYIVYLSAPNCVLEIFILFIYQGEVFPSFSENKANPVHPFYAYLKQLSFFSLILLIHPLVPGVLKS